MVEGDLLQEGTTLLWPTSNKQEIDEKVAIITTALTDNADRASRPAPGQRGPVWWTLAVTECKAAAQRWRRAYHRSRDPAQREACLAAYHEAKNIFRKELRRSKRKTWRRFVEEENAANK